MLNYLRNTYWIGQRRKVVTQVIKDCVVCKKAKPSLLKVLNHLIYQVIVYQMIMLLAILALILQTRYTWKIFMGTVIL